MEESILITIKKLLGLDAEYTAFDTDVITHINTTFWTLRQLGVGRNDFTISDSSATWSDYFGTTTKNMEAVKTYIYLKVRLLFDPPNQNASLFNAYQKQIEEYESRFIYECDPIYE